MQVFMSYSAADRKFAERLREELIRNGLSVWADSDPGQGAERREKISQAIRSADDILILVGARSRDDTAQQLTWQRALEAVWQDSRKRLIPVLLRTAEVPRFVYSDASGNEVPLVRIVDPRDLRSAAQAVGAALRRNRNGSHGLGIQSFPANSDPHAILDTKASYSHVVEEERKGRLLEIKQFAERLKQ